MRLRSSCYRGGAAALGLVAGAGVASAVFAFAGASSGVGSTTRQSGATPARLEVSHLPPLLRLTGERAELRYDIYCLRPDEEDVEGEAPCEAGGTVFVRAGSSGPFRAVPLELDPGASEGRYVARVPADIAASPEGFSYYALLEENATGTAVTVPAGGSSAPQRSLRLDRPITVALNSHRFGATRPATARVIQARWGEGPDEVGLEPGPSSQPIGGASFDVSSAGAVTLLDEAHRRLLQWRPGSGRPQRVPLAINGTIADLSVGEDGSVYVLETTSPDRGSPVLRHFAFDGRDMGHVRLRDRTSAQLRLGPEGPVALQYPSAQWMPIGRGGNELGPLAQAAGGKAGRPAAGGREVVVWHQVDEVRVAMVGARGVAQAWRVTSATPLGEVQLVEPYGAGLVVVLRVYEEGRDEFEVLVLDRRGLVRRFSLDSADWAETAPLSRFRLVGSSLYQLGSTAEGLFVDRYDLGVTR